MIIIPDIKELLEIFVSLIKLLVEKLSEINTTEVLIFVISLFVLMLLIIGLLLLYFNERMISLLFTQKMNMKAYVVYSLLLVFVIFLKDPSSNIPYIFLQGFFVIIAIKLLGTINENIGKEVLKIIGGFVFIQTILSPKDTVIECSSSIIISILIVIFLLLIKQLREVMMSFIRWINKEIEYFVSKLE